ncbi:MAG: SIS domain-containing protein [Acidobacteriota bacterium]
MSGIREYAAEYFDGMRRSIEEVDGEALEGIAEVFREAWRNDRRVFILGNGGSATTASHMATDLGKGTAQPGVKRFKALSVTDNMGLVTAYGNDMSYDDIFVEQIKNHLEPGDVVVGITGSGNSPNVLKAIRWAREHGAVTVGFIGFGGGKLAGMVDHQVTFSSCNYGIVEDLHLSLNHILSQFFTRELAALRPAAGETA